VLSRRHLAPEIWSTVCERLATAGVSIVEFAGDRSDENKTKVTVPPEAETASAKARRELHWACISYPSHNLLDHQREIVLARRHQAARNVGEHNDASSEDMKHILDSGRTAREELVLSNIRLVYACSKAFLATPSMSPDDLVQEGILGLFRAVDGYDPERGYRFSTYATWWINQAIQRALTDGGHCIRVPESVSAKIRRLDRKAHRIAGCLGRAPMTKELAHELGCDVGEINLLLQIKRDAQSIEDEHETVGESTPRGSRLSSLESPEACLERKELNGLIEEVLDTLDARSRRILVHRFGLLGCKPRTLEHLGIRLGITKERVRQIQNKALQRIMQSWRATRLKAYGA
jgi:RNA polymerase sigma factor (sigma-70 family)